MWTSLSSVKRKLRKQAFFIIFHWKQTFKSSFIKINFRKCCATSRKNFLLNQGKNETTVFRMPQTFFSISKDWFPLTWKNIPARLPWTDPQIFIVNWFQTRINYLATFAGSTIESSSSKPSIYLFQSCPFLHVYMCKFLQSNLFLLFSFGHGQITISFAGKYLSICCVCSTKPSGWMHWGN